MKKNRVVCFDYLRVLATVSVILLHVSAEHWYSTDINGAAWNILNICNSAVRWAVPVFVMVSGSLFLSRDVEIKTVYGRYIPRMAVAGCVWAAVYAPYPLLTEWIRGGAEISGRAILYHFVEGHYHLWFIPMIIGLYMCIPLFRKIAEDRALARYFLLLSFVFAFLLPEIFLLARDFAGGGVCELLSRVESVLSEMNMSFVAGYSFYFILGHVLNTAELTKGQRRLIYGLGLAGLASTVLLTAAASRAAGAPVETYYSYLSVQTALAAAAVFVRFRYRHFGREGLNAAVSALSGCCFGVYLVHVLVLDVLAVLGLDALTFHPLLSVPLTTLAAAAVSFAVSFVLNRIPLLNRWIV